MADVKFGVDQLSNPAPKGYRKFERAWIIVFAPGLSALIMGWGLSDSTANKVLLSIGFSCAVVKGIGMLLGNGQEYSDRPGVNPNEEIRS